MQFKPPPGLPRNEGTLRTRSRNLHLNCTSLPHGHQGMEPRPTVLPGLRRPVEDRWAGAPSADFVRSSSLFLDEGTVYNAAVLPCEAQYVLALSKCADIDGASCSVCNAWTDDFSSDVNHLTPEGPFDAADE